MEKRGLPLKKQNKTKTNQPNKATQNTQQHVQKIADSQRTQPNCGYHMVDGVRVSGNAAWPVQGSNQGSMLTHTRKAVCHEGTQLGNKNGEKNHLKHF